MPNALTKQAAARPLVRANMPTAMGISTATSGVGSVAPPSIIFRPLYSGGLWLPVISTPEPVSR